MKENINGTQVHYKLTGQGKTRVMLLHGWGCDLHLMEPVANALAETHQILLVDFPELPMHPNCRCTMAPIVEGFK